MCWQFNEEMAGNFINIFLFVLRSQPLTRLLVEQVEWYSVDMLTNLLLNEMISTFSVWLWKFKKIDDKCVKNA